jgi:hypothetical protein
MAAEYTMSGRVVRCREVTRTVGQNGVVTETWGDFLPLTYCGHDGRIVNRTNRLLMGNSQLSRDDEPNGGLPDFSRPEVIVLDGDTNIVAPEEPTDKSMSSESKFLLIAAAVVVGLVGLVFVFKK